MKQLLSQRRVSLGIATTLSGGYAPVGSEMKQAVELAVEEQNSAGGMLGAIVETHTVDDASDATTGQSVAHKLSALPEVLGVVGHYSSDISIAASGIYHDAGLVMITPIGSNPAITDRGLPNVFRYTNRDDHTGRAIAGHLYSVLGKRRAALVESQYAYGRSMAQSFARAFVAAGGEIVSRHSIEVGATEFGPLVHRLPSSMDMVFYGGAFEGAGLLRSMRAAGLRQLFAAGDGCWDVVNFVKPAAGAAVEGEGVLVLSATPAVGQVAGSLDFANRYQQRHGPLINYGINSYDSARVVMRAIEDAAVRKGRLPGRADVIHSMRRIPFRGIAYRRPLEWTSNGDNLAAVTVLHTVEGGEFRQIAEIDRLAEDLPVAHVAQNQ